MFVLAVPQRVTSAEAACRLAPRPGLCWLDSDGSGELRGAREARFSFLASDPVEVRRIAGGGDGGFDWLDELDGATPEEHGEIPRWSGYISYDAGAPAAVFARYDAWLVWDHHGGRAFVAADDARAAARLQQRLHARARVPVARMGAVRAAPPDAHLSAIALALQHIAAGDVYQVNLARSFVAPFSGEPLALGLAMRGASPVPLGFYFDDAERTVISRTMERFLRWDRATRVLHSRPIKGTLARLGDDAGEARALASDPKERAEHAMIIDLMRNDLGRVAQVGSVRVPQIMAVERYAELSHLVSTVQCTTRPETRLSDVLAATFPPGSVTGTPKRRATELIARLEAEPRGVYTGAVGYVDRAGGLSLAVAIRTAVVQQELARYLAGGGIVASSVPERELAETELKARVFTRCRLAG